MGLVMVNKTGRNLAVCRIAFLLVFLNSAQAVSFDSRKEIPEAYKWDLRLYYEGWDAWEEDIARVEVLGEKLVAFEGRLHEGPETLLEMLQLSGKIGKLAGRTFGYAAKLRDLDTRASEYQERFGQVLGVYQRINSRLAWIDPEILEIPEDKMLAWIEENPGLEPYRFGLMDTYREAAFTLDAQSEKVLRLHGKVRGVPGAVHSALTNADSERPIVILSDGSELEVTAGTYGRILSSAGDPTDRRRVQEARMEEFEKRRNTFAAIYDGVLKQGWAGAESRGYGSTLEAALHRNAIPSGVLHTLIEAAREGASELQRYHRLRQEFLGLENYGWSDMHVPLVNLGKTYPYDEVVPLITASVSPLGEEYQTLLEDQFRSGMVDVYETPGKRSGAYNSAQYGVGSFVLLNYQGTLNDVFTVAHEMGHSAHSRLSNDHQPYPTHRYTIFVAEVASILNEKLLLRHMLDSVEDPLERISLLEMQIKGIFSTFYLQTMMADFELRAHGLVEAGKGISADGLTALWKEVVEAYFGEVVPGDDPYMHSWARIPHLFSSPFYVYQYATCYASAASILQQMDEDPEAATGRYLELLKSGGNDYPMNQLRRAGVDLTDPAVVRSVVDEFSLLLDEMERACNLYLKQREENL